MFAIPAPTARRIGFAIARPGLSTRNRIIALLLALGLAAALLGAPQFTASSSAATSPRAVSANKWASTMLSLLNSERRRHHLRPLRMTSKLTLSAHRHNATMAKADSMSHQLPGEAYFANRISATGYRWQSAGENIGWNSSMTNSGLQVLERQMYGEKAPGETGHRQNILSRSFRQIGIDVYFDNANHKMWFTQDFGQPA